MNTKNLMGFSLLEVLVSLFILSVALLGLDAMQIFILQQTKIVNLANTAQMQLQVLSEKIKLIKSGDITPLTNEWNEENKLLLPNGKGEVVMGPDKIDIKIGWGNFNCEKNTIASNGCLGKTINAVP